MLKPSYELSEADWCAIAAAKSVRSKGDGGTPTKAAEGAVNSDRGAAGHQHRPIEKQRSLGRGGDSGGPLPNLHPVWWQVGGSSPGLQAPRRPQP